MGSREPVLVTAEAEFSVFYDRWHQPIRRALALALGDTALGYEAADEAMARAVGRWEQIRGYERPAGWVYRVGLNWARDIFRKRKYEVLTSLDRDTPAREIPFPDPDVMAAVGRLSLRLRSIVVARYYLDWSTAEVAAALDIPEGTVKSRLSRALKRLAVELGETE